MDTVVDVLVIIGGFFLRIGVPILFTFGLAVFLRRLDQRWQAEAEREHILDLLTQAEADGLMPAPPACWDIKGCTQEDKEKCPAFLSQETPCWDFQRIEGKYADDCLGCEVMRQVLPILVRHTDAVISNEEEYVNV